MRMTVLLYFVGQEALFGDIPGHEEDGLTLI